LTSIQAPGHELQTGLSEQYHQNILKSSEFIFPLANIESLVLFSGSSPHVCKVLHWLHWKARGGSWPGMWLYKATVKIMEAVSVAHCSYAACIQVAMCRTLPNMVIKADIQTQQFYRM